MIQRNPQNLETKIEPDYSPNSERSTIYPHQFEEVFIIINKWGMHARPAAMFVKTANQYDSEVTVKKVDEPREVSGKSIMSLMGLGLPYGSKIQVHVSGNGDAKKCLEDLRNLVNSGFAEAYK